MLMALSGGQPDLRPRMAEEQLEELTRLQALANMVFHPEVGPGLLYGRMTKTIPTPAPAPQQSKPDLFMQQLRQRLNPYDARNTDAGKHDAGGE